LRLWQSLADFRCWLQNSKLEAASVAWCRGDDQVHHGNILLPVSPVIWGAVAETCAIAGAFWLIVQKLWARSQQRCLSSLMVL